METLAKRVAGLHLPMKAPKSECRTNSFLDLNPMRQRWGQRERVSLCVFHTQRLRPRDDWCLLRVEICGSGVNSPRSQDSEHPAGLGTKSGGCLLACVLARGSLPDICRPSSTPVSAILTLLQEEVLLRGTAVSQASNCFKFDKKQALPCYI